MYNVDRFTIPEVIEKSAAHYGDLTALAPSDLRNTEESLSYRQLEERSRGIAALLVLLGVKQGDRVALLSENRPGWGLCYFAISRAGAVAVPIMTAFTDEQIASILDHSGSVVMIASKKLASKAPAGSSVRLLIVDDLERGIYADVSPEAHAKALADFTTPAVAGDDLASILYTSGTMGNSKGVMLTHRNLVSNAIAARKFIVLRRTDRLLSVLPLAHAYEFTIGFLIPMMQGSAVYYLDKPPSATALLPALAAIRPTIMLAVPLIIEKVVRSSVKPALEKMSLYKYKAFRPALDWLAGRKLKKVFGGHLRFFGIGGAPLAADVESFLHNARFPYSIGYGLTETAPLIAGNVAGKVRLHTTGVPPHGVELRIADKRPDTGEGEIQARGPNVFPGYYKDAERTAESFTEDGWFRTGDLGTIDRDGRVTVRGRLKTMILGPSGENIYPEEIEALLNASPYVLESLVYGGEKGVTALVHLKPEALEQMTSRIKDGIEQAEIAAGHLAQEAAVGLHSAEHHIAHLLESIRKETNTRLAGFSRLSHIEHQKEPFEKTPKQSIKRFLYPKK